MASAKHCDSSAYALFGALRASAAIGYDRGCIVRRSCITTMDAMDAIFEVIAQSPAMAITLFFTQIFHFIVHCARLKHDIILTQPANIYSNTEAPLTYLSTLTQAFLADLLKVNDQMVMWLWANFGHLV